MMVKFTEPMLNAIELPQVTFGFAEASEVYEIEWIYLASQQDLETEDTNGSGRLHDLNIPLAVCPTPNYYKYKILFKLQRIKCGHMTAIMLSFYCCEYNLHR
ncbi:MAG: hypothetical protein R3Y47_05855 [Lachnospiraceae bacterium]